MTDQITVPMTFDPSLLPTPPPSTEIKPSRFFAHRNGVDQTGVIAGYSNVVMTTTRFNTGGLFDTTSSIVKMPAPGWILQGGQVFVEGMSPTGPTAVVKLIKNGTPFGGDDGADVGAGGGGPGLVPGYPFIQFGVPDECVAGDTYELIIAISGGGSLNGNPAHTYWWGFFYPDPTG